MVFDYPDWQTPQAHATRVAATGVPLLRASNQIKQNLGQSLAGGASSTLLTAGNMTQPGYEIGFRASMPAGTGTVPFIAVELLWTDSVSGIPTARRDIVITCGNGIASRITSFFNGPCRGNTLQVIATNLDPSVTATIDWTINQTSHVYEHDQAGQLAYPAVAPNGFNNPSGINGTGVIVSAAPTLSAGQTAAFLCALYGGDVVLEMALGSISVPVLVQLRDAALYATGSVGQVFYSNTISAGGTLAVPLTLPFTPANLVITHQGTSTTISPGVVLVAQNH